MIDPPMMLPMVTGIRLPAKKFHQAAHPRLRGQSFS
jgi:hypothetical protein